ncbi:protein kinase [Streptomyces sp. NPDC052114]|uniref:protein kinase n=1 Tax=unclassified Streptomyces TaxID=2593676 RepID=UPI0034299EDC
MDDYAGRVLADRYRLPLPPADEYELAESRAFDTYSGQEVLVRQVPLPEIVEAEVLDETDLPDGFVPRGGAGGAGVRRPSARTTRRPTDPAVRRAIEAAQTAAQIPDHPRLDQVFDVFAEGGSLWIVSELVAARPLAALLADRPLSPYRAAEVAADVLAALRVLHAHGWVHRNITARTVLICDDGRVMLTGLAAGAAEEALCGYDPRPVEAGQPAGSAGSVGNVAEYEAGHEAAYDAEYEEYEDGDAPLDPAPEPAGGADAAVRRTVSAYRTGTLALPGGYASAYEGRDEHEGRGGERGDDEPGTHGRISDPYGVAGTKPWHGAVPRSRSADVGAPEDTRGGGAANGAGRHPEPADGRDRDTGVGGFGGAEPGTAPRGSWDDDGAEGPATRGPATALAAERARHARMVVVGAVTERWSPEQAGPVHENWRLAAPIGPATDLWALGALLFRAVQGHAPYPEDSTAELVQLVCAEPPAFAEECGPLRPVVESLLRQDPTDRLDFEELSGWLRSLVRSAPEPEAGAHVVPVPPYDAGRLPIVRRRGEVVRKRRGGTAPAEGNGHGRHKRGKGRSGKARADKGQAGRTRDLRAAPPVQPPGDTREPRDPGPSHDSGLSRDLGLSHEPGLFRDSGPFREPGPSRGEGPGRRPEMPRAPRPARERPGRPPQARGGARPRSLGRLLLLAILLGLAAAVVYAMMFMPKSGESGSGDRAGNAGEVSSAPEASGGTDGGKDKPEKDQSDKGKPDKGKPDKDKPGKSPGSQEPQTGPELPQGFTLRKDPEGFRVAVASGWDRQPKNGRGQVRYTHGDFELLVVPGRDSTGSYGGDPMKYQREDERELQPFRDSSWATSSGMRRIDVGGRAMAEGQFTWQDTGGREVYVRNLVMVVGGKYHVVQVRGPEAERDEVTRLYEQASASYQVTG